MLESMTVIKMAEQDDYERGCDGEVRETTFNMYIKGDSPAEYVADFAASLGFDPKWVETDVCDDPGRVECARMEDDDGLEASAEQMEQFKLGNLRLWYVTYTAYAEQVTRRPATFA